MATSSLSLGCVSIAPHSSDRLSSNPNSNFNSNSNRPIDGRHVDVTVALRSCDRLSVVGGGEIQCGFAGGAVGRRSTGFDPATSIRTEASSSDHPSAINQRRPNLSVVRKWRGSATERGFDLATRWSRNPNVRQYSARSRETGHVAAGGKNGTVVSESLDVRAGNNVEGNLTKNGDGGQENEEGGRHEDVEEEERKEVAGRRRWGTRYSGELLAGVETTRSDEEAASIGRRTALVGSATAIATTITSLSLTSGPLTHQRDHHDRQGKRTVFSGGIVDDALASELEVGENRELSEVAEEASGSNDTEALDADMASTAPDVDVASTAHEAAAEQSVEDGPHVTSKVFMDVAVENQPIGRIVIGIYGDDVGIAAQRFAELATGKGGISYRRKIFYKITPTYIQHAGVRFNVSAGNADAGLIAGGPTADVLIEEMKRQQSRSGGPLRHVRGSVSLVMLTNNKDPPKQKLIAREGKLMTVEEPGTPDPNGTEFAIATADAPELDATNIVVGRVLEGMDVVEKIVSVPVNRDNSDNPYFKIAKSIGDSRAKVAERGFNRPMVRVVVAKSGVL